MRSLLALLLISLPHALYSQAVQAAPKPETAAAAPRKALFWRATNGKNTIHLLGSIHLGSKDMYPLPKEIEDAFDSSTALIVEVDMKKADMQKLQTAIMEKGMYTDGDSLWNHVTPETKAKVEAFCEKFGFPSMAAAKMKPWMFGIFASVLPIMKNGGMDPNSGVDMYFMNKQDKVKDRVRVVEIETAEQQIEAFASLEGKVQETQLVEALEKNAGSEKLKDIQSLWLAGDAEKLEKLVLEMDADSLKVLINDRNKRMADVAEQFLKGDAKEQGFVVVGAAHMIGKQGIVKLLEGRGYKVERVALK